MTTQRFNSLVTLVFDGLLVKRLVTHAASTSEHCPDYSDWEDPSVYPDGRIVRYADGPYKGMPNAKAIDARKVRPALSLVKDHGIYLMSNGLPILHDDENTDPNASLVVYAKSYDPAIDDDWYDRATRVSRDDFVEAVHLANIGDMLANATKNTLFHIDMNATSLRISVRTHKA